MRIVMAAMALTLWAGGAAAATPTCTGLVRDATFNERVAQDGAGMVANQKVPVTQTDRDGQLAKVIYAALMGHAALAACAAPGDLEAAAPLRKWQPGREAEVSAALTDSNNCRSVLYVVQTVLEGARTQGGDAARTRDLVDAALWANEAARQPCPDYAANIAEFAVAGAAHRP